MWVRQVSSQHSYFEAACSYLYYAMRVNFLVEGVLFFYKQMFFSTTIIGVENFTLCPRGILKWSVMRIYFFPHSFHYIIALRYVWWMVYGWMARWGSLVDPWSSSSKGATPTPWLALCNNEHATHLLANPCSTSSEGVTTCKTLWWLEKKYDSATRLSIFRAAAVKGLLQHHQGNKNETRLSIVRAAAVKGLLQHHQGNKNETNAFVDHIYFLGTSNMSMRHRADLSRVKNQYGHWVCWMSTSRRTV